MNGVPISGEVVAAVATAFVGGGGAAAIIVKAMSKPVDDATADKIRAEAKEAAQRTASSEVDTLREIIAEVRASEAKKSERIDSLETRLEKLEERERHALTRAAVHEAWDQLAFNFITGHDRKFPPPPPLAHRPLPEATE
ncbi:MAG: hypothetical protein HOQ27_12640 [Dermatophilaceae bacterium]|nr:hypothetical protein [Dermatophilaceae bacterium]NUR79084.1 hypothetical protein [Dermatophilaceae bacterium]